MLSSKHFRFEVIAAGKWSRKEGTIAVGMTDEARPHLIPTTKEATLSVAMTEMVPNGYCLGKVTLDDGTETFGYRFIVLTEEQATREMAALDRQVEEEMAIVD